LSSAVLSAVVTIAVALVAATPGVLAYRASRAAQVQTSEGQRQSIEAGAYERARESYEAGLKELERQLARLREQLAVEQDVSNQLRNQLRELDATVATMRQQMARAGIDITDLRRTRG
jgi:septal ring factor EnvC (AmiA/AmiB activator)